MTETCHECNRPIANDDAAPSCGAHILHIECSSYFHCRWCYRERRELRMWTA